jgi:hypothetical protein
MSMPWSKGEDKEDEGISLAVFPWLDDDNNDSNGNSRSNSNSIQFIYLRAWQQPDMANYSQAQNNSIG